SDFFWLSLQPQQPQLIGNSVVRRRGACFSLIKEFQVTRIDSQALVIAGANQFAVADAVSPLTLRPLHVVVTGKGVFFSVGKWRPWPIQTGRRPGTKIARTVIGR